MGLPTRRTGQRDVPEGWLWDDGSRNGGLAGHLHAATRFETNLYLLRSHSPLLYSGVKRRTDILLFAVEYLYTLSGMLVSAFIQAGRVRRHKMLDGCFDMYSLAYVSYTRSISNKVASETTILLFHASNTPSSITYALLGSPFQREHLEPLRAKRGEDGGNRSRAVVVRRLVA